MSKRLGIYTGHVYESDDDPKECCVQLKDKEETDIAMQNRIYNNHHKNCKGCFGCPESFEGAFLRR